MSAPYRRCEFNVLYGIGIDRVDEMMNLLNDYNIGKKWGKTFTLDDVKYELNDFLALIADNPEFYEELKQKVVDKIKNSDDGDNKDKEEGREDNSPKENE